MLELKRIYWAHQLLRLAMAALTVWIFAAAILSLVARSGNVAVGGPPNTVTAAFTRMFDGVLAAVAVPGILAVVLTIIAAVIQRAELRRRVQHVQPCERRADPVTCAAGKAGTTTADLRHVRRCG